MIINQYVSYEKGLETENIKTIPKAPDMNIYGNFEQDFKLKGRKLINIFAQ